MMDASQKYAACADALKEYAEGAGFTDVVIGLSGGIDSSLVAVMCVDAFGASHVHGVLLPGPYSSEHSVTDAEALARNLGIQTRTISIKAPYEAFADVLADACGGALEGLAAENTQARCRMVCLMALSNAHGWMLVNTGNRSEAMMGYSTLYGDTAGAFAPIGGIYKTDVYALSRWRNQQAADAGRVPPIPENVLVKPPSAELAPGQQDERSMGIEYAELDRILEAHLDHGMSPEEVAAQGHDRALVDDVLRRVRSYAFKRALEPPFPQVAFYE